MAEAPLLEAAEASAAAALVLAAREAPFSAKEEGAPPLEEAPEWEEEEELTLEEEATRPSPGA